MGIYGTCNRCGRTLVGNGHYGGDLTVGCPSPFCAFSRRMADNSVPAVRSACAVVVFSLFAIGIGISGDVTSAVVLMVGAIVFTIFAVGAVSNSGSNGGDD